MITVKDFDNDSWRAIAWTGIYVFIMWAVLHYLFNFNMFSYAHWARISRIELHGFPGLVFGVMVLAAVPLYIATMVLMVRNKSLPVRVPLPNCLTPEPEPEPEPAAPIVAEQDALPELRPGVPLEMRESFMRVRKNYGARQQSVFNKSVIGGAVKNTAPQMNVSARESVAEKISVAVPNAKEMADTNSGFPLPDDFDSETSGGDFDIPVFSNIDFDSPTKPNDITDTQSQVDKLCQSLIRMGIDADISDDLITGENFVIAVHDDEDFWVADDSDWFAAGKQKPSPISELKNAVKETDKKAIMFFGEHNIMDFDVCAEKWRNDGITVVTSNDELLHVVKNFSE